MADVRDNEPVRVKSNGLLPSEIEFEPDRIREQNFRPDLGHQIALVAGYDGQHEHIAQVDASGKLMVNAGSSSYTQYEVHNITVDSVTPSAANVIFSEGVSSIDLHVEDNDVYVKLNITKTDTLGDTIMLPAGDISIPYTTDKLAVWCSVSGSTSTVQIVGWW
jgi:hypothetical protein